MSLPRFRLYIYLTKNLLCLVLITKREAALIMYRVHRCFVACQHSVNGVDVEAELCAQIKKTLMLKVET